MSVWKCPVCGSFMQHRGKSWSCAQGHNFDMAKSGYVNLLPVNRKHAKNPGDNAVMMRARKNFLDAGHYALLLQALEQADLQMETYGVDISKSAADAAAKRCPNAHFAVGSVYHLPVADRCCDMLMTIFAPYCGEEYHRVLHKGGTMLMVIPGQQHLWGLKEAIYDVPYPNAVRDYALDGFELIQAEYVDSWLKLDDPADIQNLFQMTPYYYKTGREEHARLEQLESLSTQISFEILQYRAVETE